MIVVLKYDSGIRLGIMYMFKKIHFDIRNKSGNGSIDGSMIIDHFLSENFFRVMKKVIKKHYFNTKTDIDAELFADNTRTLARQMGVSESNIESMLASIDESAQKAGYQVGEERIRSEYGNILNGI